MHVQSSISKKYFKYLSESPAKNSLGQEHVSGLRLFLSGDSDKYLKYSLLIEPQLLSKGLGRKSSASVIQCFGASVLQFFGAFFFCRFWTAYSV